jgi:Kdo2-lipid IVA lauroyltransferase/acyltransferase
VNWEYLAIRFLTYPLRWLPFRAIHSFGRFLGTFAFYLMPSYRKRALSNLALARELNLSPSEIIRTAKESFQNLAINCLEYPKLDAKKDLSRAIVCENPEEADALYAQGKGIIFFCGHQSNWEVLFLDGTKRMKGVAIGKSIKNKRLYQWIISIREKFGGRIISNHNAIREGFKALKKGVFLGIVGDQGMPNSGYSFPFLGRRAWTSTAPAMLSYRTNSPIIIATTRRVKGGYRIHYSAPIWPNLDEPLEKEMVRLMDASLNLFQESVKKSPGEWLWQHNRWKQQTPHNVYKRFRKDCLCIILPKETDEFEKIAPHLPVFRQLYPTDFIYVFKHESSPAITLDADKTLFYSTLKETLKQDYRFKLVFNFSSCRQVRKHYLNLSAFEVFTLADLTHIASPHFQLGEEQNFSEIIKRALSRPGSLWGEKK